MPVEVALEYGALGVVAWIAVVLVKATVRSVRNHECNRFKQELDKKLALVEQRVAQIEQGQMPEHHAHLAKIDQTVNRHEARLSEHRFALKQLAAEQDRAGARLTDLLENGNSS